LSRLVVIQVLGRTQLEKVELQKFISHLINLCRSLGMVIFHSMVAFFAFYIFFLRSFINIEWLNICLYIITRHFHRAYRSAPLRFGRNVVTHSILYSTSDIRPHTRRGDNSNTNLYTSQVELTLKNRLAREECPKIYVH